MSAQASQAPHQSISISPKDFDITKVKFELTERKSENGQLQYRINIRRNDGHLIFIKGPENEFDDPSEWCHSFGIKTWDGGNSTTLIALYTKDNPREFQKKWYEEFKNVIR